MNDWEMLDLGQKCFLGLLGFGVFLCIVVLVYLLGTSAWEQLVGMRRKYQLEQAEHLLKLTALREQTLKLQE